MQRKTAVLVGFFRHRARKFAPRPVFDANSRAPFQIIARYQSSAHQGGKKSFADLLKKKAEVEEQVEELNDHSGISSGTHSKTDSLNDADELRKENNVEDTQEHQANTNESIEDIDKDKLDGDSTCDSSEEKEERNSTFNGMFGYKMLDFKEKLESLKEVNVKEVLTSVPSRSRLFLDNFSSDAKEGWQELMNSGEQDNVLAKKFHQAESFRKTDNSGNVGNVEDDEDGKDGDSDEKTTKNKGPSSLVFVKEPISQWDTMKQRLQDSPFIRQMLKGSKRLGGAAADTSMGKKAQDSAQAAKDKMEDAREFWETSQNPVVYALSGVWDNMTGQTEEGICLGEIMKLDPDFNKEEWAASIKQNVTPQLITAHLEGDIEYLEQGFLGEGVLNKLSTDIKLRNEDSITFDTNILDIDEMEVHMKILENDTPMVLIQYLVQQINCVRKKGEIIEGSETNVKRKIYNIGFMQEYDEDDSSIKWRIVDYEFGGDVDMMV